MSRPDIDTLAGRLNAALARGRSSGRLRGLLIQEAVTGAMSGPNIWGAQYAAVSARLVTGLQSGLSPRAAAKAAIEAAYASEDRKQAGPPSERQRVVGQLAARLQSALSQHDPDRAAFVAASGLPGMYGLAPHLAAAVGSGLDPQAAAAAAYDAYRGGAAESFGDALLDRSGGRPRRPERQPSSRSWDDLNPTERMIAVSWMAEQGRGGEEPSSADINAALASLSSR
jgi:hypothetical protein